MATRDAIGWVGDGAGTPRRTLTAEELAPKLHVMTAEERAFLRANKPNDPASPAVVETQADRRKRVLTQAMALGAGKAAQLIVTDTTEAADDEDWALLREDIQSHGESSSVLGDRKAHALARIAPAINSALALGGKVVADFWITPSATVQLDTSVVEAFLAGLPDGFEASLEDGAKGGLDVGYTGLEARTQTSAWPLVVAREEGGHGNWWGNGAVRLGIIEPYPSLIHDHPGFRVGASASPLRWGATWNCATGTCVAWSPVFVSPTPVGWEAPGPWHATWVTQVAASSLLAGQDPAWTTVTSRRARSGIAPGVVPYFYTAGTGGGSTERVAAIQRAVLDGLDSVNLSYHTCATRCDTSCIVSADRAAMRNAQSYGMLITVAAGNHCPDGINCNTCTVNYPATMSQTLAVGALQTDPISQAYSSSTVMRTDDTSPGGGAGLGSYATARGGLAVTVDGVSYAGAASLVDVMAPGCISNLYAKVVSPASYGYAEDRCGTSLAAPFVSGVNALLAEETGGYYLHGMNRQAFLMMLGDGWDYETNTRRTAGLSPRSGAGRIGVHTMGPPSLSGSCGASCHGGTLSDGQVATFDIGGSTAPEPSTIRTWKAALVWDEAGFSDVADLDLSVVQTLGGGSYTTIAGDYSRDLRARLRLTDATVAGKALQMRVHAYHVPPSQTRSYRVCQYYQSDNTTAH